MNQNKLIPDENSDLPIVYKDLDEENLPNRLLSNFCEQQKEIEILEKKFIGYPYISEIFRNPDTNP